MKTDRKREEAVAKEKYYSIHLQCYRHDVEFRLLKEMTITKEKKTFYIRLSLFAINCSEIRIKSVSRFNLACTGTFLHWSMIRIRHNFFEH